MFDIEKPKNDSPELLDDSLEKYIADVAVILIDQALKMYATGQDDMSPARGAIVTDEAVDFLRCYFNSPELAQYDSLVKISARVHQDTVRLAIGSDDSVLVDSATGPVRGPDNRIIFSDTNFDHSPSFVEYLPLEHARAIVANRLEIEQ